MILKFFSFAAIIFLVASVFGLVSNYDFKAKAENFAAENVEEKLDPIEELLKNMTLEEKIGQMFVVGVPGKTADENTKILFDKCHFGGVIFFDKNMDDKTQVKNFSDELQKIGGQKFPLFIALDEEGGRVARMKHALIPPLSQEEIGSTGDFNLAKITAESISRDLKEIGVNINFAPVADVGTNDTRSFSKNAEKVSEFVSNAAQGYELEKMFYCLKHFPGLGRGKIDTHQDISSVDADKETLFAEDLLPFSKIIFERDNSNFMVMVGHLKYLSIDPENAASLSYEIITNILRKDLNFQGVVITDDLNMGAVANYDKIENLAVKSIKAGADIVLICHEYEAEPKSFENVLNAVKKGEISEERINESVRRILKMKTKVK
ncbi:MAG: glycoside hydrolase family 3 protein [Selenomonadaceae bacterium]|nr:glycoside hydrolase family 3 protein [Selenomonadaceae bacterium]